MGSIVEFELVEEGIKIVYKGEKNSFAFIIKCNKEEKKLICKNFCSSCDKIEEILKLYSIEWVNYIAGRKYYSTCLLFQFLKNYNYI